MTATVQAPPVDARRPGPRGWLMLTLAEAKMVVRDTAGLIVPIGLPLLILVMSASAAVAETAGDTGLTGLEAFVLPLVFAIVFASIGVINMPSFLAYYRRSGILRRLSVTPASPAMVLVAQVVVSFVQALIGVALALALAIGVFGARLPADPWLALGVGALGLAAMYAVGLVVAALAPTPNSATAIGLVVFFALGALGGLFGGRGHLPEGVARVGVHLPVGATLEALAAAWLGVGGDGWHVVSLVGTVLVGSALAAIFFRW